MRVNNRLSVIPYNAAFGEDNERAMDFYENGDYEPAERLFRQEWHGRQALPGQERAALTSMNNLGMTLSKQGKHAEAQEIFQSCLNGLLLIFDETDEETLAVTCNITACLFEAGQKEYAESLYQSLCLSMQSIVSSGMLETLFAEVESSRNSVMSSNSEVTVVPLLRDRVAKSVSVTEPVVHPLQGDKTAETVAKEASVANPMAVSANGSHGRSLSLQPLGFLQPILDPHNVSFLGLGRSNSSGGTKRKPAIGPSSSFVSEPSPSKMQIYADERLKSGMFDNPRQAPRAPVSSLPFSVSLQPNNAMPFKDPMPSSGLQTFPSKSQDASEALDHTCNHVSQSPKSAPKSRQLAPASQASPTLSKTSAKDSPPPKKQGVRTGHEGSIKTAPTVSSSDLALRESTLAHQDEVTPSNSPTPQDHDGDISVTPAPMSDTQQLQSSTQPSFDHRISLRKFRRSRQIYQSHASMQIANVVSEDDRVSVSHISICSLTSISTAQPLEDSEREALRYITLSVYHANRHTKDEQVAVLDTGADADCISIDYAEFLQYKIETFEGAVPVAASSELVKVVGMIKMYFRTNLAHRSAPPCKRSFLVVEGLPHALILGCDFIAEYGILQFNNKLLPIVLAPISKEKKLEIQRKTAETRKSREDEQEAQDRVQKAMRQRRREQEEQKSKASDSSTSGSGSPTSVRNSQPAIAGEAPDYGWL